MANSQDIKGAALENAVFLELHRRKIDARPYIEYDSKGNETKNIDFAFEFEGRNILLQVTHEINANDEEREVTNLLNISGNYEKYIVYVNNLLGQEAGITYLTADKFFINFL
jgi:predicted AAA+ superfamily ATPase